MERLLVVDDDPGFRALLETILRGEGYAVASASTCSEAKKQGERQAFHLVLTDLRLPDGSGLDVLRWWKDRMPETPVVVITAFGSVESAVEAMKLGAVDYLGKPLSSPDEARILVRRTLDQARDAREATVYREDEEKRFSCGELIASDPRMAQVLEMSRKVSSTNATVLILGESGTGKEILARCIHRNSQRAQRVFVAVNCAALAPTLIESELFGHERGSFTGAAAQHIGRFERAHGGTLFLDEIGELDANLQAKLLRVLQEQSFERVGSSMTQHVDVRVLVTTNRDLYAEVKAGQFRPDLYFRLAVVPIHVPPLRQRREDIPQLVDYFLARAARRLEQPVPPVHASALELLVSHPWPGNVRELENIITRASVLCGQDPVTADQLRPWLLESSACCPDGSADGAPDLGIEVGMSLQVMERRLIETTLEHFQGHRAKTAQALGIGIRTLANKLRSYGYAPREKSFIRAA
jgi:DNA-binding NtrC family response regulator